MTIFYNQVVILQRLIHLLISDVHESKLIYNSTHIQSPSLRDIMAGYLNLLQWRCLTFVSLSSTSPLQISLIRNAASKLQFLSRTAFRFDIIPPPFPRVSVSYFSPSLNNRFESITYGYLVMCTVFAYVFTRNKFGRGCSRRYRILQNEYDERSIIQEGWVKRTLE